MEGYRKGESKRDREGEERRRKSRRRKHSPSSNLVLASSKQVLISSGSDIYKDWRRHKRSPLHSDITNTHITILSEQSSCLLLDVGPLSGCVHLDSCLPGACYLQYLSVYSQHLTPWHHVCWPGGRKYSLFTVWSQVLGINRKWYHHSSTWNKTLKVQTMIILTGSSKIFYHFKPHCLASQAQWLQFFLILLILIKIWLAQISRGRGLLINERDSMVLVKWPGGQWTNHILPVAKWICLSGCMCAAN